MVAGAFIPQRIVKILAGSPGALSAGANPTPATKCSKIKKPGGVYRLAFAAFGSLSFNSTCADRAGAAKILSEKATVSNGGGFFAFAG